MPEIKLKKIQPNRLNPRLEFRKQALDELADSIKQVGLIEPIIVRPRGKDTYEVVVGERRYRAAQQAGLDEVPVIIRDYTEEEVLELNLIENIQREDLSAVEKARVCQQLRVQFPDKYPAWEDIAKRIGVNVSTVRNWSETLNLPKPIQQLIAPKETERVPQGKIDYDTAIRIGKAVQAPSKQVEIAKAFAKQRVAGRPAREILRRVAQKPQAPVQKIIREVIDDAPVYLPFSKIHADAILHGKKTQTARKSKDPKLQRGTIVRAQVTHFADLEIVDVSRKRLGDFDEEDAKREGGYTLAEFKKVWKRLHGIWDPDETVYVIQFQLVRVMGEDL